MQRLKAWFLPAALWRRAWVVFGLGLFSGLAFAPTYVVPAWPLAFGITLALLFKTDGWRGRLWLAFLFNYGTMISGVYWVALAPATFPGLAFMVPLALFVLPAFLGLFGALAMFLGSFWRRNPLSFAGLMGAAWLFFEWRRGLDLTGPGWNRVGMIWTADPLFMQVAAWGGVYLLSAFAILMGMGVFMVCVGRWRIGTGFALAVPLILLGLGAVRLALNPIHHQDVLPHTKVRLVQANIPKGGGGSGRDIFDAHITWSTQAPLNGISHVIWPEGSIRDYIDQNPAVSLALAERLAPAANALAFARRQTDQGAGTHLSAYLLDLQTLDWAAYDKSSLVPFGEYIPFRPFLSALGFRALTGGFIDRRPGQGPKTLRLHPDDPGVGVFVCYDSIYTGRIVDQDDRPAWLATITEDAWYIDPSIPGLAKTPGPYQHAAEARLRAVEEGLSVARASNPGISLVYDPFGRVWSPHIPLNQKGAVDSTIPAPLPPTPYAHMGPAFGVWAYAFAFLFVGVLGRFLPRP